MVISQNFYKLYFRRAVKINQFDVDTNFNYFGGKNNIILCYKLKFFQIHDNNEATMLNFKIRFEEHSH